MHYSTAALLQGYRITLLFQELSIIHSKYLQTFKIHSIFLRGFLRLNYDFIFRLNFKNILFHSILNLFNLKNQNWCHWRFSFNISCHERKSISCLPSVSKWRFSEKFNLVWFNFQRGLFSDKGLYFQDDWFEVTRTNFLLFCITGLRLKNPLV